MPVQNLNITKTKMKKENNTPLFDQLASINVNTKTEKRNGFTYLSWAWAWSEFKKHCPDAQYDIVKDPHTNKPYMVDEMGIMVTTRVTTNGETHEMWLPVMDGANNAQKLVPYTYKVKEYKNGSWTGQFIDKTVVPATMFDVNKAIMRCLVKNLAMFGLGIYIYAGEDLPEMPIEAQPIDPKPQPIETPKVAPDPEVKPTIENARFKLALKSISDGTYTEDKLREKFQLSDQQETDLENHMVELEKAIEDMAKSFEGTKPEPKKKATPKKATPKK